MHHQDFSGDPPPPAAPPGSGSRKAAYHFRRGSGSTDDHQAGTSSPATSSPGPHHQSQSSAGGGGGQVKKKSGFQITSVTSAQVNVSGNNSLADDTESYDDMDESHTEDLSSSDMLDASVSRAADAGIPERSSSDETLNSLHGVDTPGLVSPNEPPQPQAALVNGAAHQHYYPPRHADEQAPPTLPVAPLATSSPAMAAKTGQTQRPPVLDNGKTAVSDLQIQSGANVSTAATAAAILPSGFDNTNVTAHVGTGTAAAAANTQTQHTQAATGSRFRVVKLDTNSEPFRKGRWTCTEYYEKEVPHVAVTDTPKGAETMTAAVASEAEGMVPASVQPPHTLQPYQPPTQDFTSPQTMQSPPQAAPASYAPPQDVTGATHVQKAPAPVSVSVAQLPSVMPQQLSYVVDPHQAAAPMAYPPPQLRQPDFIQPTAPFQTQVQPPPPHLVTGLTPILGLPATQQVVAPPTQPAFSVGVPQTQPQHHPAAAVPLATPQVTPYMPLTALQADLQPLLAPGASFPRVPAAAATAVRTSSQLEDAQKLLLQHQGLLGLPRLGGGGAAPAGGRATEGSLAHMAMSAEASAFMAAAAGLRSQHGEGDEDR